MSGAAGYPGVYSSGIGGAGALAYPPNFIENLLVSRLSNTQVQIAVGNCRDDSNADNIVNTGVLTVDITTTGANGRNVDTAEQSNKWYAVDVIKNITTGAVAGFLINEDDLGAFTYPAGYTIKKRVGWIRNDGSGNLRDGRYFGLGSWRKFQYWVERPALLALSGGSSLAYANVDLSEWVPPTSELTELNLLYDPFGTSFADVRPNGSSIADPHSFVYESTEPSNTVIELGTDSAQIIEYQVFNAFDNLDIYVCGFFDQV